jgi:hypothetical protein
LGGGGGGGKAACAWVSLSSSTCVTLYYIFLQFEEFLLKKWLLINKIDLQPGIYGFM